MDGIMNNNQLTIVKEYNFDNPLIQNINSIISECYRDCHHKYFHTFDFICEFDLNFTNINNNEIVNFTISDKSMGMYELNQKLTLAKQRGYIFNQINKLTIKIYSNLFGINIHYYLKHHIPMGQRLFFRRVAKNRDYIQTHCNDLNSRFHFACRQWYNLNNTGELDQI